MLDEVIFNYKKYKYRIESKGKLLLYDPRTSGMFFVSGNTYITLLEIIETDDIVQVNIDDKYISYFLAKGILMRRNASND